MKGKTIFDSRFLTKFDGYAIRFTVPGSFRYDLGTEKGYEIVVVASKDKSKKGTTHNVTIQKDLSLKKGFVVKPENIEISSGDLIMWHFENNKDSIIVSIHQNNKKKFTQSNQTLTKGAIFSHCFTEEGECSYKNLVSKTEGKVQVKSIKETSREEWIKKISKPKIVQVTARKMEPKSIAIVEGQTVIWLIERDAILQGEILQQSKRKKIVIRPKIRKEVISRDIEKISQRQAQKILSVLNQWLSEKKLSEMIEIPNKRDIGIKLAKRILDEKKKIGKFKNLSEIYEIDGIGPKRFGDIAFCLSQI